jgi:hypothetical protein
MTTSKQNLKIGIDFGGVLSIHDGGNKEHINTNINMPNSISSLEKLKNDGHILYLISYCGKPRAIETKKAIDNYNHLFAGQYYVTKREYKGFLCNYLDCDIMIDDRASILEKIKTNYPKTILIKFGEAKEETDFVPDKIAKDWDNVIQIISSLKFDHSDKPMERITDISKYIWI